MARRSPRVGLFRYLCRYIERAQLRLKLQHMSDRQLADIGVCRKDIGKIVKCWLKD